VVCGVRHMVMPTVHIPMCHEPVEMYLCTACKHVNIRACESAFAMLVALHMYMTFCALQRCTPSGLALVHCIPLVVCMHLNLYVCSLDNLGLHCTI